MATKNAQDYRNEYATQAIEECKKKILESADYALKIGKGSFSIGFKQEKFKSMTKALILKALSQLGWTEKSIKDNEHYLRILFHNEFSK